MPDPRRFDLVVRSTITGLIAMVIIVVVAVQALRGDPIDTNLVAWGGIIIGVYFGSHTSLNGSGIRAARDQALTKELLDARPPVPVAPVEPPQADG